MHTGDLRRAGRRIEDILAAPADGVHRDKALLHARTVQHKHRIRIELYRCRQADRKGTGLILPQRAEYRLIRTVPAVIYFSHE